MVAVLYQIVVVAFASYLAWFWLLTRYPASHLQALVEPTPAAVLDRFASWRPPVTPPVWLDATET